MAKEVYGICFDESISPGFDVGSKELSYKQTVDETTETGKKQAKYHDWNAQSIYALTCAFTKEAMMN